MCGARPRRAQTATAWPPTRTNEEVRRGGLVGELGTGEADRADFAATTAQTQFAPSP